MHSKQEATLQQLLSSNRKQVVDCRKKAARNGRWRGRSECKSPVDLLQIWEQQTCLYALNHICMDCRMRKSINLAFWRGLGWCLSISVFRVFNKNEPKIKNRKVPQTTISLKISSGIGTLWCHYMRAILGKLNYQSWQKTVWQPTMKQLKYNICYKLLVFTQLFS